MTHCMKGMIACLLVHSACNCLEMHQVGFHGHKTLTIRFVKGKVMVNTYMQTLLKQFKMTDVNDVILGN